MNNRLFRSPSKWHNQLVHHLKIIQAIKYQRRHRQVKLSTQTYDQGHDPESLAFWQPMLWPPSTLIPKTGTPSLQSTIPPFCSWPVPYPSTLAMQVMSISMSLRSFSRRTSTSILCYTSIALPFLASLHRHIVLKLPEVRRPSLHLPSPWCRPSAATPQRAW